MDISTACTGICLLNDDGTFHSVHHVELKKEKSFYKKVDMVVKCLRDLDLEANKTKFYVEEPLMMFKFKASMAKTISLLQRFNAAVCFSIYKTYQNAEPKLINVLRARNVLGIHIPRGVKKKLAKQYIFEHIRALKVIPDSHWVYKRTGKVKDWVYDECDATVIAFCAFKTISETVDIRGKI